MLQKTHGKTAFTFLLLVALHFTSNAQIPDTAAAQVRPQTKDSIPRTVADIIVIGNKITKPSVVLRELTFHKNDTLNPLVVDETFSRSEENLMNTSLFNSAHVTSIINDQKTITVYVIVTERWYIFPFPIFEIVGRNFNEWWRTKDYSKINYGGVITWNNFRGRNETIGMTLRLGYTQRISFFYNIPFISKKQKSGLSFAFAYLRSHETAYENFNNDIVFYKDENKMSHRDISGSIQYTYRKGLYETHILEFAGKKADAEDTIIALNPDFFSHNKSSEKYFSLRYIYKFEHRDLVAYPLHGYYMDFEAAKIGFTTFKDDVGFSYAAASYKRYWQLSRKFYFSSSINGKISDSNPQPFYNIGGLGFGTTYLRGYEYYVVLGENYGLLKTNLKFELLPTHIVHAGFVPLEKFATIPYAFYFNLYADAGYSEDHLYSKDNNLSNSWLYSGGAGIDFVTYYDLVFRLEYSVNRFGESGIFLHFSAPI